jgi:hypothetical protein
VRSECTTAEYRSAAFSPKLWKHKKGAKDRLSTKTGIDLRKKRCFEVETVFGQIKGNLGFRRFKSTGFDGVSTEWGLLMMGYNMKTLFRLGA